MSTVWPSWNEITRLTREMVGLSPLIRFASWPSRASTSLDEPSARDVPAEGEDVVRHFAVAVLRRSAWVRLAVVAAFVTWTPAADARVKKIVVEKKVSPAFEGMPFGAAG